MSALLLIKASRPHMSIDCILTSTDWFLSRLSLLADLVVCTWSVKCLQILFTVQSALLYPKVYKQAHSNFCDAVVIFSYDYICLFVDSS